MFFSKLLLAITPITAMLNTTNMFLSQLTTNIKVRDGYLAGHSAIKVLVLTFISDQRAGRFEPVTVLKKVFSVKKSCQLPRVSHGLKNLRWIKGNSNVTCLSDKCLRSPSYFALK